MVDVDDSGTRDGDSMATCQALPSPARSEVPMGYLKTMAFNTKRLLYNFKDDVGKPHFRKPP